jgi:voltage-gated potassium channel
VAGDSEKPQDASLERVFYHTERVPFVHWREFSDAKTSVVVTGAIAVLSFVTGLSKLSGETVALDGPLAVLVPQIAPAARFAGVVFAFLLAGITVGLQSRKRLAWYAAVAVLPLVALLPLTTLQRTDIPLFVLVVAALPLLVANRGTFDQRIELSSLQIAALSAVGGVFVYGTIGSYALRSQFGELVTWGDAVYYVIITIATVGYGDITPLTAEAKWFSLSVVLFGTGAFTAAVGSLVVPAIESRMAAAFGNMTPSELTLLDDHVLILGYSDITDSLLDELAGETDVVVVTDDSEEAADLNDRDVNVLTDDPTDEAALRDARIEDASGVVVGTRDDAQDVLAILAAKTANPDVRVVAAANEDKNVSKLREVGADEVISPTVIGGRILGRSVLDEQPAHSLFDGPGDGDTDGDGAEDRVEEN